MKYNSSTIFVSLSQICYPCVTCFVRRHEIQKLKINTFNKVISIRYIHIDFE